MIFITELLSTGFYTGYLPKAPGTWGSWAAAMMFAAIAGFSDIPDWALALAGGGIFFFLGVWSSTIYSRYRDDHDPGYIVIDEFSGQFLAYLLVPMTFTNVLLGFLLFRVFDITKPWPANISQNYRDGWGIMLDDVWAGIYAAIVLFVLRLFF